MPAEPKKNKSEESPKLSIELSSGSVIRTLVILFLFFLIFILRDVVLVILTAIVVASSVEPATKWLMSKKIPRLPSVIAIYFSATVILIGVFYYLFLPVLDETSILLQTIPNYEESQNIGSETGSKISGGTIIQGITENISLSQIISQFNMMLSNLSQSFWGTVSVVFGGLLSFVLIIVLSFYLAVQEDGVGKFLKTISPLKHKKYVVDLWKRAEVKIGLWMQGQLLLGVIIAVLVYLGLALLGVRHALLLAVLAGIFELIPLFGPILAAIPAVLLAYLDGGISSAVIITGFYLIIQQFENQLIYPLVVKKVVGVPAIVVIIALIVGAKLAGFLGLILAVPVAAVMMEFIHDIELNQQREE